MSTYLWMEDGEGAGERVWRVEEVEERREGSGRWGMKKAVEQKVERCEARRKSYKVRKRQRRAV